MPLPEALRCPECGSSLGRVRETRRIQARGFVFLMRVRQCHHCGYHYRTKEITDDSITEGRQPRHEMKPLPPESQPTAEEQLEAAKHAEQQMRNNHIELPPVESPFPPEESLNLPKKRGRPRKKPHDEAPICPNDIFPEI